MTLKYFENLKLYFNFFKVRFSRNFGGGSLMVWLGFSEKGKIRLAFPSCRMNAQAYVKVLEDHMLIDAVRLHGYQQFRFQQDNAPIHNANFTKNWFRDNFIRLIGEKGRKTPEGDDEQPWPALSPDLNPVENLWAYLVRKVYHRGRQYQSIADLKNAIVKAWEETPQKVLHNLVKSMPDRIFEVISKQGGKTSY